MVQNGEFSTGYISHFTTVAHTTRRGFKTRKEAKEACNQIIH
ncbi:Arm DNA-binding domain-containing protein [Baia soyae]